MNGRNITFPIYNEDGTSFENLVMHKATSDQLVMSLGYKITGDVFYKNNKLEVTMKEYIVYEDVKYYLVNPPTVIREGLASENGENKGMTKYSFEFYHPMYFLSSIPFSDVAVSSDETKYKSQDKTFSWIGTPDDYVMKLNKNLEGTEFVAIKSDKFPMALDDVLSEVIPFDNAFISDALKTAYDTWGVPYVIDSLKEGEYFFHANNNSLVDYYDIGKRFVILWGLPSNEIYESAAQRQLETPYIFRFGKGVGLKNNSRTPRNNKIITRISGYGSESNIPYGYPQIVWSGNQEWDYTINNNPNAQYSYPIYKGIVGGEYVKLIKHPFTRTHLMPSIYTETVNKKVNPFASGYNPLIEIKDYYDAMNGDGITYPNEINAETPSYEIHEFDIKPELGSKQVRGAIPLDANLEPADAWDDTMDDEGNYIQSYFQLSLPLLDFDLYACAAITQEMQISMRGGACMGCTFTVQVDWDDYKANFYDEDGNFAPDGERRDYTRYPDSSSEQIDVICQKDNTTFGILMPNTYQRIASGDEFVILGISLPTSYITNAEARLDEEMKSYMLENNVYYHDYPLKFDELFLVKHQYILNQIRPNCIIRFMYGDEELELFVKQITIKYGEGVLPQYDITLTDNVEVTLNQIGKVADDVEKLTSLIAVIRQNYNRSVWNEIAKKLSKVQDDTAQGKITFAKGLQVGGGFVSGLLGEGGVFRKEADGKTYIETDKLYVRFKAYFDEIEVKKYEHSGGNRIASKTGIKTIKVEYYDANDELVEDAEDAAYYRCYFRLTDDDGTTITNDWVVGDLARSQEFRQGTNGYWRAVVGIGATADADGLGYIDLSKRDCLSGSDVPQEQDDIIQLGNKNNTTRQGAIIEFTTGGDAPAYQIYQGINSYDLTGKNVIALGYNSSTNKAYMNVYGDAYIGDRNRSSYIDYNSTTGQMSIKAAIDAQSTVGGMAIGEQFEYLQEQIDGSVANWYVTETPTLLNYPASDWVTDEQKDLHIGELAYNKANGNVYRFVYDEANDLYKWELVPDEDVPSSLRKFADLQYLADALGENTSIVGGLILTSLIQLRDTSNNVLSGISGLYDTSLVNPKKSIAAWYGGTKTDWETLSDAQKQAAVDGSYAKSLFRMDGSGYVATGNISWDENGYVTLKNIHTDTGESIDELLSLFSLSLVSGTPYIDPQYAFKDMRVLSGTGNTISVKDYISLFVPHYTYTAVVSPSGNPSTQGYYEYNSTTQTYSRTNDTSVVSGKTYYSGELTSIEATAPLWSQYEISALGYDSSGGGGGGGSVVIVDNLTSTSADVALSGNMGRQLKSLIDDTNTRIDNYTVDLSNYYTKTQSDARYALASALSNYYTKTEADNKYALSSSLANYYTKTEADNKYALASALSGYLPLSGGTMTGTINSRNIIPTSNNQRTLGSTTYYWQNVYSKIFSLTETSYIDESNGNICLRYNSTANLVIASDSVRRGASSDSSVTLGTSTYRWGNLYSVLGNFSGLLTASGNIKTASYIEIGDYRIVADTTNTALKVVNKDGTTAVNFYATGEVSALGANGSGGGGGGVTVYDGLDSTNPNIALSANQGRVLKGLIDNKDLSAYALKSELATVATSGSYNDLSNKPTIPAAQIQSDWNQTSTSAKDYIKNKPTIPAAQIQSDWNQTTTTAKDYIKNKPTLNYLPLTGGTLSGNLSVTRASTSKVSVANANYSASLYIASNNQRGLYDDSNTRWIVGTNGTNTFMMGGNVGINTSSPSYQLHVNGYTYATRYYANGENYIGGSSSQLYLSIGSTNPIVATSTYVRRGTSEDDAAITLGTSSYRWANVYSDLGNFSGLLTASGNIKTDSYIEIGDYRIVADTDNTALKVIHKNGTTAVNFYATGENSALGVNTSGGGGGGGIDPEAMWSLLANNDSTKQINYAHLTTALQNYATQSWVNQQGFLTSYTETDPVFTASAAHGITSSDITSWNNKVSNVQANWNATSGLAVILNKPTLATVATSGKYSDLTGKPTNVSSFTNDANYVTSSSLTTTLRGYLKLTGGTLTGNLSVEKSGTTSVKVTVNNDNGSVSIYQGTGNNRGLYDDDNSKWIVATNDTNTFMMDGNVGINTTSPSYQLHVNGDAYATNMYLNGGNRFGGNSTQLFAYIGTENPLVIGSDYIRRGTSATDVTLGTSSYRWANLYSVLGNFSGQITSSVATGTSPLSVSSTTLNANLNADLLDGYHATEVSRLGWTGVNNGSGSSDQCKWYEVSVPTSSNGLYVYEIISRRNAYPFVSYYRLAIYRYNSDVVSVSLINQGMNYEGTANNTKVCVAIDSAQKVYIQSGSRTAANYMHIRPIFNAGSINSTAVGEAAFGTANGFTALKMVTNSGYFRVDTSASTQATTYDGDPTMITSIRIGDAYIWWDGSSLRISGASSSNGKPSASVAVNVNVSGEVSALQTT